MEPPEPTSNEYVVTVSTNDIREAIARLGSALYDLVGEALLTHDCESDNCEFENFARHLREALASHPDALSWCGEWDRSEEE